MQFQNTKSDLGNCPKRYHEEKLKEQFLAEGERFRADYEKEFMAFLEKLVNELERKLRKGKDRLDVKPNDPTAALNPVNDEFEERRTIIDLQIKELLAKIEQCGEEGRVQEAQEALLEVERHKAELEKLRLQEAENPSYRLEKRMEVCQTCGAFLIIGDAVRRIEAHFEGKQHNGWARIREALADLKRKYEQASESSPEPGEIGEIILADSYVPSRSRSRDRHHRDRAREREQERGMDRNGDKDRAYYSDRRDRHSERSFKDSRGSYRDSRDQYRYRDRDRDGHYRR